MSAKPPPYTPLPSEAPPAYTPEAEAPGYSPAPPVVQHSSNTVIMTQPGSSQIRVTLERRAGDNFLLTIVMMVICGVLLNIFAFACLIPALLWSMKAREANSRGDYQEARQKGQYSLWLNLTAMISYIALMIIGIVLGLLLAIANPAR